MRVDQNVYRVKWKIHYTQQVLVAVLKDNASMIFCAAVRTVYTLQF